MKAKYENAFAIDLLWLRIGKVGGSESFIRNLIAGLGQLEDDFRIYLMERNSIPSMPRI